VAKTYAIADLHGRFDLLNEALRQIHEHAAGNIGTVVTLGDYVDRGPESGQIIQMLMGLQAAEKSAPKPSWNFVCLKGNHEDMMVETLTMPLHPNWWIGNGGGATLISYGHPPKGEYSPELVPREHIEWLDNLPTMHVDEHRIFVHAGVDPTRPLDEQTERDMLWMLYPDGADLGHGERHVVHGHHQFEYGPILLKNRTDLDTFAWLTGRLVVGVFDDDLPGGPVDTIEIQLARDPRFPAEQSEAA
jgi:serine/threonine protein phosphatase 1